LGVLYQDHLSTQDGVEMKKGEDLINIAMKHYAKFKETAASNSAYKIRVLESDDRVATIKQTLEFNIISAKLEKQAAEMAILAKKQEDEERKRLLDLEKQAMEAEGAGDSAPPAAPPAAAPAAAPAK